MAFARLMVLFLLLAITPAMAQPDTSQVEVGPRAAPTKHVEVGQLPTMNTTPSFDVDQATQRYLAKSAEQRVCGLMLISRGVIG